LLTWRREHERSAVESGRLKLLLIATVKLQRQLNIVGTDAGIIVQRHDNLAPTLTSSDQFSIR